jgi:phosphatidate cytidylyltransferase
MLPPLFALLWLGIPYWIAGVAALSAFGFREFARATGLALLWPYAAIVYALIVGLALCSIFKNYGLFMALPIWATALTLTIPVLTGSYENALRNVGAATIGIVYFAWFPAHLGFLGQSDYGLGYVLFVVLATQFNDVIAFLAGKLFGKTHWTRISPNKTLEASIIALFASIALAFANWKIAFPHFEWWLVALAGLIVGLGGQVGDLVMSAFKRDLGIKDFGETLPGHGGVLDRMDSLIWVAPLFFHTARFFHGGFGA